MVGVTSVTDISGKMDKSVYDSNGNAKIDSVDAGAVDADGLIKIASANQRHAIDAEQSHVGQTYNKEATLTFTTGIKGVIRISFGLKPSSLNHTAYGILTQNGATPGAGSDLGTEQTRNDASYGTKSQDITVDIAAGETIDLWLKNLYAASTTYENQFRFLYDNIAAGVAVTGAD